MCSGFSIDLVCETVLCNGMDVCYRIDGLFRQSLCRPKVTLVVADSFTEKVWKRKSGVCVLQDILVSCKTMLLSKFANHQAKDKIGCQPGDCKWPLLIFLENLCGNVWFNTLSHSQGPYMETARERKTELLNTDFKRI